MKAVTDRTTGFHVRDYRQGDFEKVSLLWIETGMGHPARGDDEDTILATIRQGGRLLLLEEEKTKTICGSSWLTTDGRRVFIHYFGILPAFQGKKLSHLLMERSLACVKETGLQVKLEVHNTNLKAINLYKKYGFEYLGDYDVYIIRDLSKIKSFPE
ncbi:MAG TPA: GNAT family N-acetyltransferase [Bacteroidales bacterium]|nr:GNAT family N-acetyltransferase [Bacteroidales bacterium]